MNRDDLRAPRIALARERVERARHYVDVFEGALALERQAVVDLERAVLDGRRTLRDAEDALAQLVDGEP
jgi:hypothetical protein